MTTPTIGPARIPLLAALMLCANLSAPLSAQPGSEFTYQARVETGGAPLAASADFEFTLWSDPGAGVQIGQTLTISNVDVDDGLFTVELDFGFDVFDEPRWLEIALRSPAGAGAFTTLTPRQPLRAAPLALALPAMRMQPSGTPSIPESPNVIGGTRFNTATANAAGATIAGGGREAFPNRVEANFTTVGGGLDNSAGGASSTVPGGFSNDALGAGSFAAGQRAKANHDGAFVWADDSSSADFESERDNQFRARADGGVRLDVNDGYWFDFRYERQIIVASTVLTTSTGARLTSGGVWSNSSDANLKQDFESIDPRDLLSRVAELPITTWSYRSEHDSIRHIGPTAQDFRAAFGFGGSSAHIDTIDVDGVALAAIQALHQLSSEQQREITKLEEVNQHLAETCDALRARIDAIESLLDDGH